MNKVYLDLLPEQIGALWCFLDGEYLAPHPAITLAVRLERLPAFHHYDGDLLEEVIDIVSLKIKKQLDNPLVEGNVELSEGDIWVLRKVFDELYPEQFWMTNV